MLQASLLSNKLGRNGAGGGPLSFYNSYSLSVCLKLTGKHCRGRNGNELGLPWCTLLIYVLCSSAHTLLAHRYLKVFMAFSGQESHRVGLRSHRASPMVPSHYTSSGISLNQFLCPEGQSRSLGDSRPVGYGHLCLQEHQGQWNQSSFCLPKAGRRVNRSRESCSQENQGACHLVWLPGFGSH